MKDFNLEVYNNKFETRDDLLKLLEDTLRPLEDSFINEGTRVFTTSFSSGAEDSVGGIEGFLRLIWGIAAVDEWKANHPWWITIRQGLIEGCNRNSENYFGDIGDFDQRIVETAAIGYAMVLKKECIYDPLSDKDKKNLITWISQVNRAEAYPCNWMFFRVIVNIGLRYVGLEYDKIATESYLDQLDSFYVEDGWYKDGAKEEAHADYYIPFAMHFYGLFYAKYMNDIDPERAGKYKVRAKEFAKDFIYWFSNDGSALPYGRSLTYRYAQVAFWCILSIDDELSEEELGVYKGIILRNIRWWHSKPIYDSKGRLTVGYGYENLTMAENYNAAGSVYWSLKTLLILKMDKDHSFWKVVEQPLLETRNPSVQKTPGLVFYNPNGDHILAYNSGSQHTNAHTHVECKYEKFVYSSLFGFSTPKSQKSLEFGAFDCTLAVSEDGKWYRHKELSRYTKIEANRIISHWKPYDDVSIHTTLILSHPWHIRIHDIDTDRKLEVAEGGFAINKASDKDIEFNHDSFNEALFYSDGECYSTIEGVQGYDKSELILTAANTNIMASRAVLPTLKAKLCVGKHRLISFVAGDIDHKDRRVTYKDVDYIFES